MSLTTSAAVCYLVPQRGLPRPRVSLSVENPRAWKPALSATTTAREAAPLRKK